VYRDYRGDLPETTETFFRRVRQWKPPRLDSDQDATAPAPSKSSDSGGSSSVSSSGSNGGSGGIGYESVLEESTSLARQLGARGKDAPPVFHVDGISYIHVKKNNLYFVATTKYNISPSLIISLLNRLTSIFKDYCGQLTEEALKKNFVLVYELLDEAIDYGQPQFTSTETLKAYIHNTAIKVTSATAGANQKRGGFGMGSRKTIASTAVNKPISLSYERTGANKSEIFVDVLERLTVLFNSSGNLVNSTVDGCIQLKSYLWGNPSLSLALNEDLVVGRSRQANSYGGVILDDCNFHECIDPDHFEQTKCLNFVPPDGEFVVMNYRISGDSSALRVPFRVFPILEELDSHHVELKITVRSDFDEKIFASNFKLLFSVPETTGTVANYVQNDIPGQTTEYMEHDKVVQWRVKKFAGNRELYLRTKINLLKPSTHNLRKEVGPLRLQFEIPMYNISNLRVRYLKIDEPSSGRKKKSSRWVRTVSQAASYVIRL